MNWSLPIKAMSRFSRHSLLWLVAGIFLLPSAMPATTQQHYYAHKTVVDKNGVIAPWY
jgi:hypothetical protein